MIKIAIIGTRGVPATYGGFETLAEKLIEDSSCEFCVYCSGKHYPERMKEYKGAKLKYIPLPANGVMSVLYDVISILHAVFSGYKNLLILGVSGAILFPLLSFVPKIRIVTNIDGIEWRREKWNWIARLYLKISEFLAVRFSSVIVADNIHVSDYLLERYGLNSTILAYGGDHAINPDFGSVNLKSLYLLPYSDYALSICRIEPENNVHMILEAFLNSEMNIILIGNWGDSKYGKNLYDKYKSHNNITLLDPIYCPAELHYYRISCSVYIHGHSAGGTNPSLVEMMHFSKPIVAYDCLFNRATMEEKGNYFSNSIGLYELLVSPKNLASGDPLKEIAQRRYTWDLIRCNYLELFESRVIN